MLILKELREAKKVSLQDLAEATGLQVETISGLETGIIETTTTGTLLKLAHALGVSVDDLFL